MRYTIFLALLLNVGFSQTPSDALKRLMEGNERYTKDQLLHPNRSSFRREEIQKKQLPFATILGCSDSRVAPEIVFDQGLGDLFTVRVAGNVVGPVGLDSIDYSVKYLGSTLVVVLGHEACGAVTAVMDGNTADIEEIAGLIQPAIEEAEDLEEAVKANVRSIVTQLKESRFLKQVISTKKIECIGAYYHLKSGRVEILK